MKRTINMVAVLFLVISTTFIAGCGDDSTPFFPLSITTASPLPAGTVGSAYGPVTLSVAGGIAPFNWSVASDSILPAGLALSAAGVISGTPTTVATSTFTINVTGSIGLAASKQFSLTVNPAGTGLTITTASPLAAGTVGTAYGPVTLAATGGTPPYTWTVAAGSALPAGLALSAAGVISGTPTTAGTVSTNITATDAAAGTVTKAFSITVNPAGAGLSITTASPLAAGTVGTAYGPVTLAATGGTPPYTWTVAAGSNLPAGLTLSTGGVISGTPTAAGTVGVNITVTDAAAGTVTKAFSITVNPAGAALIVTTPSPLPPAAFGMVYSQTLAATGGTPPYTWLISAGALPTNLTLSSAGLISGTPLVSGLFSFTVTATDSAANTGTLPLLLTVDITASVANGRTNYNTYCAGCHSCGIYDPSGSPDLGIFPLSTFQATFGGGASHNGRTLTDIEINNMFAFTSLF